MKNRSGSHGTFCFKIFTDLFHGLLIHLILSLFYKRWAYRPQREKYEVLKGAFHFE